MKKFGEKFEEYKPLGIENLTIPDTGHEYEREFLEHYDLDKDRLPEIMPTNEPYAHRTDRGELCTFRVLGRSEFLTRIEEENELDRAVVEVAPTANVYQIPHDQQDLDEYIKRTLSVFNYYVVELGLNVMLGREFKIPKLLFEVDLKCDGRDRTDVTAYDIAPDDKSEYISLLSGKVRISLGITKLLKFVPAPIGQVIPDLLSIEINPWEFEWGLDRYVIDACGRRNYKIYWKIYKTNVVQGFNPTMIIKVRRRGVSNISAVVRSIYELKAGWWKITPEIKSKEVEIKIWPM